MARSRPRKRRRLCRAGGEGHDYLSGLSDDILLDIASRLATRHAVSFSLLSRRFRGLLAPFVRVDSVTVLDPTLPLPSYPGRHVLLRRLVFEPNNGFSVSAFRRLLDAATDRGLSELAIHLPRSTYLPRNVLSIPNLAVLSLDTCALPRWCPPACAHLRTLKLHRVNISRRMITAIFKAVPMLATLEMVYCTGLVGSCRVESSAVRNLLFISALEQREITLKLAGLTTVTLRTRSKVKMVKIQPAPKIRRAYLHIARPRTKLKFRIRPFLDAGTGLTCLTLRGVAVMLLSSEYKQTPKLAVTFEDLWILSLSLDFSNESQLCFLLKLLESCPNLKKLSLSVYKYTRSPKHFCIHISL
ncbi:hypothetical protein GUJ93_ZPchr0007g5721 [Zizania palustris]|uniref:F-box domain-containing protein n=1 Tax=Zizania palustris TaxID=103762 RepID=A0A8J5VRE5_ZIZPA|nr:hypothetical protein GUJ93_ZPchr0007g5721 [Zizania palustris]